MDINEHNKLFMVVDEKGYFNDLIELRPYIHNEEPIYLPSEYVYKVLGLTELPDFTEGFIKENLLPKENYEVPEELLVEELVPNGMFTPKWTGTEWIEQPEEEKMQEMLENPTEQMILGRQLVETELNNILLEQEVVQLKQQNEILAKMMISMELKMMEDEGDIDETI